MLSIFSYVSGPSVCLPWRSVCSSPLPIFNWIICLPGVESSEFFTYFGDQTLVWGIIGKYVFPHHWLSFHFNTVFFSHAEAFYVDEVPSVCYFMSPALGNLSMMILLHGISEIFLPILSYRTFMVLWLTFNSFIHLNLFSFMQVIEFHFFSHSYPDLPTPSVEEAIFAPFYAPASFVKY